MLNLHRLALLEELQRRGSLAAVADALSFTPSTVSQQLKVLEGEVGAQLVERVGRGLRLTKEGELLADHATGIFSLVEIAQAEVAAVRAEPAGNVRVAALQTVALALVPHVLQRLASTSPQLRMLVSRIEPARALGALAAREFDLVIGEEYPGQPVTRTGLLHRTTILLDSLDLVVPPNYEGGRTIASAAESLPWVMEPEGSDARRWSMSMCRNAGIEPNVQFESDDLLVQMRLVEKGHAMALLPRLLIESERPALQSVRLYGAPARKVFAAYRAGAEVAPAISTVLEAFASAASRAPSPTVAAEGEASSARYV